VENFRPGVMDKLGLGAKALQAVNPRLVYASISGFGQDGPDAARPAYDVIVQAMSGIMEQTGAADGPPTMVGEPVADVAGGLFGAWGIMVALYERERTGRGRRIDLALFDALASMMPTTAARVLVCNEDPHRTGNRHAISAPFGTYAAREGHFAVAVLNDRLFGAFCGAIGQPELAADPRFASDSDRRLNETLLARAIEDWAAELSTDQAVALLSAAGVPASALATPRAVWTSDRVRRCGLVSEVPHPAFGALSLPEQPVRFGGILRGSRQAAPGLNEHGDAIRAEMEELQ
jgi:CoA:oxalate CoA-transferase